MKRITVFCGSSSGTEKEFETKATELGRKLAAKNIGLVYGGAKVGLMGALADGALEGSGTVIGVLPVFLKAKEIAHEALTELILVDTLHERKTKMNELSDGVIALPGGFGTLEEYFEMLTWGQLGLHEKPMGILNVNGYYDELISFIDTMVQRGLLKDVNRKMVLISDDMDDLLAKMIAYKAPVGGKWIREENL
ncbi:MAG: TIGR00730 family Rossman fold protein [Lutimonas sp.]